MADEKATGKWFRNGKPVVENDRVKPAEEGTKRSLAIALSDLDVGNYEFRTEGEAKPATAFSATAGGLAVSLGAAAITVNKGDALALSTMVLKAYCIFIDFEIILRSETNAQLPLPTVLVSRLAVLMSMLTESDSRYFYLFFKA